MTRLKHLLLLTFLAVVLYGCASMPVPNAQFDQAQLAIAMAKQAGAEQDSPVELKIAVELLNDAKASSAAGEQEDALRSAERSAVHADLARVKAEQAKVRAELKAAQAKNTELLNKIRSQESN